MKTKKRASRKARKGRNENCQWLPGVCGNKKGRGARKKPLPKCLTEQLADAMSGKVAITDANGKQRMVSNYEAAALQLVGSIPQLKPKELILAMKWMQDLQVFAVMRQRAEEAAEPPITREDLELFKQFKTLLAEQTVVMEAAEKERRARSKLQPKPKPRPKQRLPRKPRSAA